MKVKKFWNTLRFIISQNLYFFRICQISNGTQQEWNVKKKCQPRAKLWKKLLQLLKKERPKTTGKILINQNVFCLNMTTRCFRSGSGTVTFVLMISILLYKISFAKHKFLQSVFGVELWRQGKASVQKCWKY